MSSEPPGVSDPTSEERSRASLYERVGGEAYFVALVERFYERVEGDPLLRPNYPPNLEPGKANLAAFLAQYWGGPPSYSARRGHPRLRMRHFRFPIAARERDAWVQHMVEAVSESPASPADVEALVAYFEQAATMLINRPANSPLDPPAMPTTLD
jgi:hemoglobin